MGGYRSGTNGSRKKNSGRSQHELAKGLKSSRAPLAKALEIGRFTTVTNVTLGLWKPSQAQFWPTKARARANARIRPERQRKIQARKLHRREILADCADCANHSCHYGRATELEGGGASQQQQRAHADHVSKGRQRAYCSQVRMRG